jgi:hypothetical protein
VGLQLIIQAESDAAIRRQLADVAERSEIFNIEGELWGVCVPLKVVDELGEEAIRRRLGVFSIFDLYEGRWLYV